MCPVGLTMLCPPTAHAAPRPMSAMTVIPMRLRNGDLQARVPEHLQQHAAQEFKLISRGVNEMAAALETRVAEAAAETERLETKVAERTKALQLSMKELEAFSSSVSHDLRSPLGAISGYCDRLARQPEVQEGSKAWHYLERIQARAVEMGQLIDGLLSLAQLARAEVRRQPVDLTAIAQDIIRNLQKTDPARSVDVTIEEGLTALGDRRLLHSVLDNLLSNAWKFTSRTGSARIAFSSSVSEAGETVYSVKDNGAGFDMAYAGKLFKTFERMHSQGEFPGTGIGLATAQRIIARHGGWIQASAAVDAGAEFRFTVRSTDEGTTT
ncbi:MAG: hypothetical protein EOO28_18375 [Comamonadaceae bacterium]|nr:MAG: hypothetical protein EOO28_18375 [Comamonadaceae bacterium]